MCEKRFFQNGLMKDNIASVHEKRNNSNENFAIKHHRRAREGRPPQAEIRAYTLFLNLFATSPLETLSGAEVRVKLTNPPKERG